MKLILFFLISLICFLQGSAQRNYLLDGTWKSDRGDSIVVCSYSDSLHYSISTRYGRFTFHLNTSMDTLFLIDYSGEQKYFLVNIAENKITDVVRITKPPLDPIVVFKKSGSKISDTTRKTTWDQSFFNFNTDYHNAGLLYQYPCYYFPFTVNRKYIAQHGVDSLTVEWHEDSEYDWISEIVHTAEITYYFDAFGNTIRYRGMKFPYGVPSLFMVWEYTYKDAAKGLLDHIYFPETYVYFKDNWELMDGKSVKAAPDFVPVEWQYNAVGQPVKLKSLKFETTYTYNALQQLERITVCKDTRNPLNIERFQYVYNTTGLVVKIIKTKS